MLKQLQTWDMSLDAYVEFLQRMELIDQFNTTQENICKKLNHFSSVCRFKNKTHTVE